MSHAQPDTNTPKTLGQRIVGLLFLILCLWGLALVPLGFISLGAGVPTDLRWGTCHVRHATAEETNDDETPWRIIIESTDCPMLIYTDGLTAENAAALAGTIDTAPYEVRLHESAIDANGDVRYARELKIHSYRPAPHETASRH